MNLNFYGDWKQSRNSDLAKILEKKAIFRSPHAPTGGGRCCKKMGSIPFPRAPSGGGRWGIPPRHRGLAGLARLRSPPIPWRTPRCLTDRREASPEAGGY